VDNDASGGGGPGGGRYRRSVLEASILSSLAESTTHGYNLVEHIEELASDLVCIDPGSMYRLLRGLEEQGLVISSWQTPGSGPSRRVYTITDPGIEALQLMADSLSRRAEATRRLADHAAETAARARAARGGQPAE
jgi:DNA-binding PadR family transcriptional regulator